MIGFKCDVGYVPSRQQPEKLSDVEFLDINKYFCIPIVDGPRQYDGSTDSFTDYIYSKDGFSDESYYVFGALGYKEGNYNFSETFTTFFNMYPKTYEFVSGSEKSPAPVICFYFRQLNRLVSLRYVGNSNIYKVDGDNLTRLGYFPTNTAMNSSIPDGLYFMYITDYIKGMDLTKATFYGARCYRYDIGKTRMQATLVDSFKLLFTSDSVPDIVGDIPEPGPYDPGGDSGPGDIPPGTFDDTSDPIPDSPLPSISAADTGFTRIYNPTLSQVQALARYLWTEPSLIDTIWNHIKQFFEDPMEAIIGFNLVPCRVPDGGAKSFALMFIDTGVVMNTAANQFVDVDCGTFKLERYYGSALDQNPYTKVSCFLPFIGTVHLNTDEVMGTTLQIKYRIDIVSGSCVAKIFVDGSVLYQYSGHCAITIPISAADFSSYVSAAIGVGTALAGMAAGAATAGSSNISPEVLQSTGSVIASDTTALSTVAPSTPATIGQHEFAAQQLAYMSANSPSTSGSTQASFSGINPQNINNTVGQVMGGKMQIEHSGAFSGNSGYLGVRRPFLIIERPNMCLPATYGQLNGYPSMITLNLGECKGFTRVQQVQLTGCTATNPEQSEILQFLKSGVVL